MNLLYIDANIYLRFYDTNHAEFKKLLKSISELSTKIFFTSQFGYEIDRNKLNVFKQSISNYLKQAALSQTSLPEHLDEADSPKLRDWNKNRKDIEKSVSDSNKLLIEIFNDIMTNISKSQDTVSKALVALYANSYVYSEGDINRARLRKEIGNPPGKNNDPLGDQFSWELLLNIIPHVDKLWIISKDKDYLSEHGKKLHLNPVLYKDLIKLNDKIEIKVFNTLADGLRDFDKVEKIQAIPTDDELNKISKSEILEPTTTTTTTIRPINNYINDFIPPNKPNLCPYGKSENSFLDGAYLRSRYGGLTFQYICKICGFHYDTGDFFD